MREVIEEMGEVSIQPLFRSPHRVPWAPFAPVLALPTTSMTAPNRSSHQFAPRHPSLPTPVPHPNQYELETHLNKVLTGGGLLLRGRSGGECSLDGVDQERHYENESVSDGSRRSRKAVVLV